VAARPINNPARNGACGRDSRVSLTGGTKCLFGRGGHRFDKHDRATRTARGARELQPGGGEERPIFSQAARRPRRGRCVSRGMEIVRARGVGEGLGEGAGREGGREAG